MVSFRLRSRSLILVGVVVGCVLILNHYFVDRAGRRTFQDYVALDGREPWDPEPSAPPGTVTIYRTGRGGTICYEVFHSHELHDDLLSKNGQLVTVEYDTFSDFGRLRAYNVHSIDGIVMANGYYVLRSDFEGISGVFRVGTGIASEDYCW